MRNCLFCGAELSQETIGPYCDPAHKWEYSRFGPNYMLGPRHNQPFVDYSDWKPKRPLAPVDYDQH